MGRRAIVLLVALILAGVAGWAVWNFLEGVQQDAIADQQIVQVYRAGTGGIQEGDDGSILLGQFNSDVRCREGGDAAATAGCRIRSGNDQIGDVPVDVISTIESLRERLTGRIAAGPISEGSILTHGQWVSISIQTTPLAPQIPAGKQALTIQVSNVQGVNGFVEPGDLINMIITVEIPAALIPINTPGVTPPAEGEDPSVPGGDAEAVLSYTRYVLQGIPVLAVGRAIRPDEDGDPTGSVDATPPAEGEDTAPGGNETVFTLEVTPEQAERIVHAFAAGQIWLTLVPPDFVEVETQGVILNNLFGGNLIEDIFENFGN